jgi:aspartate racemase
VIAAPAAPSRAVGVLGGMGPAATLDLMTKVMLAAGATCDQDHVRLIVDSNPQVPDRNAALAGKGADPGPVLAQMAQGLQAAGAKGLAIACNSAHAFADQVRDAVSIPLLDMVEAAVAEVRALHPSARRPGLLAADAALNARLYQRAFLEKELAPVTLDADGRAAFMRLLYRIKAGEMDATTRAEMATLAMELKSSGADVLVAACTEVPLVLAAHETGLPMVDPAAVLARRIVAFARSEA